MQDLLKTADLLLVNGSAINLLRSASQMQVYRQLC